MEHESPELLEVAALLEQRRARLTDAELDHIHRRATASRPAAPRRRSAAMRSRAAITSMLAAGFVMTGGGAALGVSALSETHSARAAQYGTAGSGAAGTTVSPRADAGGVAGAGSAGTTGQGDTVAGGAGTLGGAAGGQGTPSGESDTPAPLPAQPARQLETGESELPFTGYLGGFVLLAGLGTLAAGLTLRRGTRHVPLQP